MPKSNPPVCINCAFFTDFADSPLEPVFKNSNTRRCLKEARKQEDGWPPPVQDPISEHCEYYHPREPLREKWIWDENKNQINIKEHKISFQEAIKAKDADPYCFRQAVGNPQKWEKLDGLDFEKLNIPKTEANQDPVRDKYLFMMNGVLYKMITTLRGERGLVQERIISVHRAKSKEDKEAYSWAKEQIKKGYSFT